MASAQIIEADPMGDVILLLGNGSVGVRASSRLLSLASPVFAAMLGNRWLGGKSLSTMEPATVPLPEDHIGAITRLCRVLHYQHCGPGSHQGLRFLYISYAFGNHEAFSKCYADFIFKSDFDGIVDLRPKHGGPPDKHSCCPWCRGPRPSADVDKLTRETGTALLPDGLLAAIDDHRKEELSLLHESIERIIAERITQYPPSTNHCGAADCRHYGSEIGFVFNDLVLRRLWPKYQCLRDHTLYSATTELLNFADFDPYYCECQPISLMALFHYAAILRPESHGLCPAG